jgi:hypothetical protein
MSDESVDITEFSVDQLDELGLLAVAEEGVEGVEITVNPTDGVADHGENEPDEKEATGGGE